MADTVFPPRLTGRQVSGLLEKAPKMRTFPFEKIPKLCTFSFGKKRASGYFFTPAFQYRKQTNSSKESKSIPVRKAFEFQYRKQMNSNKESICPETRKLQAKVSGSYRFLLRRNKDEILV
jgi:hypothetical protein